MVAYIDYPQWVSPVVIEGLPFRWYGLMYLAAFVVTYLLFRHEAHQRRLGAEHDDIANFFFWGIVGLLAGARLGFVFFYDSTGTILRQPWRIIWPFQEGHFTGIQGMSYHGGLVGAIAAITIYLRRRGLAIIDWADVLAVSAPLGYTFGRIGNFINGELYGRVTTVAWGMIFPNAHRYPAREEWVQTTAAEVGLPIGDPNQLVNLPRHPAQLYEAFFEGIVIWCLLWFVFRRNQPFRGFLFAMYLVGYGTTRFLSDFFRGADAGLRALLPLGLGESDPRLLSSTLELTGSQILSLAMLGVGVVLFVIFRVRHRPAPTVETFAHPDE